MTERFSVRVSVRSYEIDANGHVSSVGYLQYAEHARWEFLRAAGVDLFRMRELGFGPVYLETVLKYHSELFYGDTVDISCEISWGAGRTYRVPQELRKEDGTLVAEVDSVGGLMDLATRRLVPQPGDQYRLVTTAPQVLGL
jgi:acyl-CoA thioester hydrolase